MGSGSQAVDIGPARNQINESSPLPVSAAGPLSQPHKTVNGFRLALTPHSFIKEHENPLKTNRFLAESFVGTIISNTGILAPQALGNKGQNQRIQANTFCLGTLSELGMN